MDAGCFVAVFSDSAALEVFYIIQVVRKEIASSKVTDANGHIILENEPFFTGKYLQKQKEHRNGIDYKRLNDDIYFRPEEILTAFLELASTENPDYFVLSHAENASLLNHFCS